MARFFVSYSRSDKVEVSKVVALLSASGHEVWWDNDIPVIADWWATILTHIEWCEVFIFFVSEKSLQSDYCLAELKYANERQRPILPFILEDPSTLHFPDFLPHRNQWLIYDGDPARMLSAINTAQKNIPWHLHKDLDVPRPPEPSRSGKSLAQLYQAARRMANDQQFEEARHLFQDIKKIDYEEWGVDCDQWLARLINYERIVELVKDTATLGHAQQAWQKYVHIYGDEFDPYPIKPLVSKTRSPRNRRIAMALVGIAIVVVISLLVLPSLNNPNERTTSLTTIDTLAVSATEVAAANIVSDETPTTTISPSDTSEPTATSTGTSTSTPSITPNLTRTAQFVAVMETQTMDAFLGEQTVTQSANMTLTAFSWTPTFTVTPTPTESTPLAIITNIIDDCNGHACVLVPTGLFSDVNGTANDAFRIGVYEITNAQFAAFMGSDPGNDQNQPFFYNRFSDEHLTYSNGAWRVDPGGYEEHPVVRVYWAGAKTYCERAGGRLPTTTEWHKAASWNPTTGQTSDYPWGNTPPTNQLANFSSGGTMPVNTLSDGRSPVSAYHMSGNVAEWVADTVPNSTIRYYAGGGWDQGPIPAATVSSTNENDTSVSLGFRCAWDQ